MRLNAFFQLAQTLERLMELLTRYDKKLNVTLSSIKAVNARVKDPDEELRQRTRDFLSALAPFQKADKLKVLNLDDDPAQDMITLCAQQRIKNRILVLTQDKNLARHLKTLNQQKSVEGNKIQIKRSNKYGYLSPVEDPPVPVPVPFPPNRFVICANVRAGEDSLLNMTITPSENDIVYITPEAAGNGIRLEEKLGQGGEGAVYRTNTPYVAKIYQPSCCTAYRKKKIDMMVRIIGHNEKLKKESEQYHICFPESPLYNQNGEFVGYLIIFIN